MHFPKHAVREHISKSIQAIVNIILQQIEPTSSFMG